VKTTEKSKVKVMFEFTEVSIIQKQMEALQQQMQALSENLKLYQECSLEAQQAVSKVAIAQSKLTLGGISHNGLIDWRNAVMEAVGVSVEIDAITPQKDELIDNLRSELETIQLERDFFSSELAKTRIELEKMLALKIEENTGVFGTECKGERLPQIDFTNSTMCSSAKHGLQSPSDCPSAAPNRIPLPITKSASVEKEGSYYSPIEAFIAEITSSPEVSKGITWTQMADLFQRNKDKMHDFAHSGKTSAQKLKVFEFFALGEQKNQPGRLAELLSEYILETGDRSDLSWIPPTLIYQTEELLAQSQKATVFDCQWGGTLFDAAGDCLGIVVGKIFTDYKIRWCRKDGSSFERREEPDSLIWLRVVEVRVAIEK
jgi:hypothetical protein